jgi:mRNA-degrading endonuclease RelE of RelBE toxin-antitoxin system
MNSIKASHLFKRKVKPLAKKYHTLKQSIDILGNDLIKNPYLGESYGKNIYKIRLADESKGKGKSGGFRVLYYLAIQQEDSILITLLTIFDKGELDTIKKKDAEAILMQVLNELDMGI